jgi:hypothetical protein
MKNILILLFGLILFSCNPTEKKEKLNQENIEASVQKIDSIATAIEKSSDELDKTIKEAKELVKELDSI